MKTQIGYWKIAKYKYRLAKEYSLATSLRPSKTLREPKPPRDTYLILTKQGRLTIKARYAWDGPSGMYDFKSSIRASLVHDALYQMSRAGLIPGTSRKSIDKLFYRLCLEDGMLWPIAAIAYVAVRVWGAAFAKKGSDLKLAP